jgi:hypothetical protein
VILGNGSADRKGQEMIDLRLAIPAILAAAAVAGCFTYFVASLARVEVEPPVPPTMSPLKGRAATEASKGVDRPTSANEKAAAAYRRAAEAILRRAQNARADARTDLPPITRPIPLPKKRPSTLP